MEEEEHTDRMQQLAMLHQKLNKIKKYLNEDDTDSFNQVIGSNSPESCLSYLMDLEKKEDPHLDPKHLTRLIDFYTKVFFSMPLERHCENESYARMLVRFAELKAIQDVDNAAENFKVATSHCHNFAFVHIAHAQFEHSQGNTKIGIQILQDGIEVGAKPKELLEATLQSMQTKKTHVYSEDKENVPHTGMLFELHLLIKSNLWYPLVVQCKTLFITDANSQIDSSGLSVMILVKCHFLIVIFRQTSGSNMNSVFRFSSTKKSTAEVDLSHFQVSKNNSPPAVSPEVCRKDDQAAADSTTSLLHSHNAKDDVTYNFNQVLNSNSPESCWAYLVNLEKRGNPHTNVNLLNQLKRCYSKVFSRMPVRHYSNNPSYAQILVRYAELAGIEDPEEAEDSFIMARSTCKTFAFVHIAHAQFEVSQGNLSKAALILQKAVARQARPAELLDTAMRNLKAGEKQLLPTKEEDPVSACVGNQEMQLPARVPVRRSAEQPKPAGKEPLAEWKIPAAVSRHVSPEPSVLTTLRCATLREQDLKQFNSSVTTKCVFVFILFQPSFTALSNESITIKGKQFFILKMIGRGGSSKVYQVLDHKKQLFAVKYVDLEEADAQTVESYKNEIEHLNHLQQYSDQIIKLYDYEITNSYIYMLMECGNLDLNTWLRNRKTVNPLERKFYWKNMLEAVHTIHKHGIVHSDLKPANFVIVNASLKLIDFGIANRIQPDVTSIMKDSQVGTLNYMPPEAIKDTSSQAGKARSKISPKGDVWSLGCILYCMTYGKTPFQSITSQITKLHAIIDASHRIEFPDISEKDLLDVLKRCLVRNPRERISIAELLEHPYLQLKPPASPEPERPSNTDLKKILTDLAALQSPNSIIRAANNLAKMCSSGKRLDVAECAKSSS
uniref:Dual specificity protein kinase TTK n=1 Tax=Salarias fasciatus TaxID=181472 RepID=A0A672HSI8_SALFA